MQMNSYVLGKQAIPTFLVFGRHQPSLFTTPSRPLEGVTWERYSETQEQRTVQEEKWLSSFSEGHLHPHLQARSWGSRSTPRGMASPPIHLSVAKMARVAGCAAITTAFSQLRRNMINDNFFWHVTNVSKKSCNQIVNLAFPFPPRSVCPSFCF